MFLSQIQIVLSARLNQIEEKQRQNYPQFSGMIELFMFGLELSGVCCQMNISVEKSTKWLENQECNIFVQLKYSTSFRMRPYE